jgi:CRP-like cAMP-binding protein
MSGTDHKRKLGPDRSTHGGDANELLRRLPVAEYDKLAADLEPVPLIFKEMLYEQGQRISHVYFPTSGVVSLITVLTENGERLETGTVGREGMVGLPVVLETLYSPARAICQIEGTALRMSVDRFRLGVQRVDLLRVLVLRYTNVLMAMVAQTAACNRAHETKARMARWLLMTHDRVDGDEFPLTQEFLGQMLGVRRPQISTAGTALQREGVIKYVRGKVTITDRDGLERVACECYKHIRHEFNLHFAAPMPSGPSGPSGAGETRSPR